ncbi:MAG: type II toxin-antitoxin system RatA family toxin [Gammaproteobacteria bacterium]|nr:type II toxin-antitoxin system RatA family toxin [Gammaproteobacteria bacterium]
MPEIRRSALMPYPVEFMYDIVNDVDSYPEFLPWCGGVKINQLDNSSMEASILMRGAGLNHWFKTRNSMVPAQSIAIELVEGPFSKLEGIWSFTPIDSDGCKIELMLQFEMKKGLASALIAPAFSRIANTMVDSFCQRARDLNER